jgi:hypothetical protein
MNEGKEIYLFRGLWQNCADWLILRESVAVLRVHPLMTRLTEHYSVADAEPKIWALGKRKNVMCYKTIR